MYEKDETKYKLNASKKIEFIDFVGNEIICQLLNRLSGYKY